MFMQIFFIKIYLSSLNAINEGGYWFYILVYTTLNIY